MALLSKIISLNGTEYDICDAAARATMAGAIKIKGRTTTELVDESTTNPVTIGGESYTAVANDAVFYGKKEFVFDGTKWNEFGDMSGLGALALKNTASATYTPQGTVSQPTFTGSSMTSTGKFTPEGSVSKPNVDVTPTTTTVKEVDQDGSVTNGTAASCTLPELTMTVQNETLTFGWTPGSFTANTPTSVTMPTTKNTSVVTGVSAELAAAPTFTGSEGDLSVTGTPEGTVSQPSFTGTEATIVVS